MIMISNNFRTILVQVLFIIVILLSTPNMLLAQINSGLVVVSIGGTGIENANSMAIDRHENIYLTGSFQDIINIGDIQYTASGDSDIFVAKIDPSGNIVWFNQAGGPAYQANIISESGKSIQLDKHGNILVCGIFEGQAYFGDTIVYSQGGSDVFLAKYSPYGELLWVSTLGNSGCNVCKQIVVNGDMVYMAGTSSGTITPGKTMVNIPLSFLGAFDLNGNLEWILENEKAAVMHNSKIVLQDNLIYWVTQQFEMATDAFGKYSDMQNKLIITTTDFNGNNQTSKEFLLSSNVNVDIVCNDKGEYMFVDFLNNKSTNFQKIFEKSTSNNNAELILDDDYTKTITVTHQLQQSGSYNNVIHSFDDESYLVTENDSDLILYLKGEPLALLYNSSIARLVHPVISSSRHYYLLLNYFGGFNDELDIKNNPNSQDILLLKINKQSVEKEYPNETEPILSASLSLHPNPSKTGIFSIASDNDRFADCNYIAILDNGNKLIKELKPKGLPGQIDLSDLSHGQYLVVFYFDNYTVTRKVIRN